MPIQAYRDVEIIADDPTWEGRDLRALTVRLHDSPAGSHAPVRQEVPGQVAHELTALLDRLEQRSLDQAGIVGLGAALADLLLPSTIRELVSRSLHQVADGEGLRLRLRLDPLLAGVPWEYAWVERQDGQRDATGFLALDPRVSIVRDETVVRANGGGDRGVRQRRLVAVLANPVVPNTPPLSLDAEEANLRAAIEEELKLSIDVLRDPAIGDLQDALLDGVDVFHFAGHGLDDAVALVGPDGAATKLPAEQLAMNLRARGVQLAVLGACESGSRARTERWSGVATRLIAAGVPAVVAMQYRVNDRTAVAFDAALYRALVAGWSLDEAVAIGRLAIYNETTGNVTPARARLWRDWGVPVLYLGPDVSVSLATLEEPEQREQIMGDLKIDAAARVRDVRRGGRVTVVDAGIIQAGSIVAVFEARNIEGEVVVVDVDDVRGGRIDAKADVTDVSGELIGLRIGTIGGGRPSNGPDTDEDKEDES